VGHDPKNDLRAIGAEPALKALDRDVHRVCTLVDNCTNRESQLLKNRGRLAQPSTHGIPLIPTPRMRAPACVRPLSFFRAGTRRPGVQQQTHGLARGRSAQPCSSLRLPLTPSILKPNGLSAIGGIGAPGWHLAWLGIPWPCTGYHCKEAHRVRVQTRARFQRREFRSPIRARAPEPESKSEPDLLAKFGLRSPSPSQSSICLWTLDSRVRVQVRARFSFGLQSPSPSKSPIFLWTPESESKEETDFLWTGESDRARASPRESPIWQGIYLDQMVYERPG
jgi:hypothetical protein